MPEEIHISSLVVHCQPGAADAVAARVLAIPGMEIHGGHAEGKLIVVLETASEGEIVERLNTVQLLDGVFAATLVFHRYDTAEPAEPSGSNAPWT